MSVRGLVLVTGAGRRVGAGIAQRLARDGWAIGVHYSSSRDGAEKIAASIRDAGGDADVFGGDLSDQAAIDALSSALAARGDWVGLVNSAASFAPDTITDNRTTGSFVVFWENLRASAPRDTAAIGTKPAS